MDARREKMLRELQAAEFTVIDLHLYLDTHPCDQRAIMLYNNSVQRARILRNEYQMMYGPILAGDSCNRGNTWQWIDSPWPCERQ